MKRFYIVCLALAGLLLAGCSTQSAANTATTAPAGTAAVTDTTAPADAETPGTEATAETATPTPEPTATPEPSFPAELGPAELEFIYEGHPFQLNTDIQPLLDALGEEYDLSESASKLYDGTIRLYDYGDMLLTTYPLDGKDAIGEVEFTGEDYQTRRGVMIGDSPSMVVEAYGEDYTEGDDGTMTYLLGTGSSEAKTPRIVFETADDIVVCIRMYGTAEVK